MKSNDLAVIIEEAEGWIGRLKALQARHDAPTVRGVPFDPEDLVGLPTFEQATGYTAVDMTTAAAQGFRDGRDSVVVELPSLTVDGPDAAELYADVIEAIIAAGGKVKE